MPAVLIHPRVGLNPTMPLAAAGTRPEPAVSVPRPMSARSRATATADPELDPPEISPGQCAFGQMPCGDRVPTRPVANWSMLVIPVTTAPAASSARTHAALRVATSPYDGQPA